MSYEEGCCTFPRIVKSVCFDFPGLSAVAQRIIFPLLHCGALDTLPAFHEDSNSGHRFARGLVYGACGERCCARLIYGRRHRSSFAHHLENAARIQQLSLVDTDGRETNPPPQISLKVDKALVPVVTVAITQLGNDVTPGMVKLVTIGFTSQAIRSAILAER